MLAESALRARIVSKPNSASQTRRLSIRRPGVRFGRGLYSAPDQRHISQEGARRLVPTRRILHTLAFATALTAGSVIALAPAIAAAAPDKSQSDKDNGNNGQDQGNGSQGNNGNGGSGQGTDNGNGHGGVDNGN